MSIRIPLCVLLVILLGIVASQHFVCMKVKVVEEKLLLECTIDKITYNVNFFRPDGTLHGFCFPPPPKKLNTEPSIECGNNITMYPNRNLTILKLPIKDEVYGVWSCKHGTGRSFDSVNVTSRLIEEECRETDAKAHGMNLKVYMIPLYLVSLLVVFIVSNMKISRQFYDKLEGKVRQHLKRQPTTELSESENEPLLDTRDKHHICSTCEKETSYAFCVKCREWLCEHCSHDHNQRLPKHHIEQIIYDFQNCENKLPCDKCKRKSPSTVCKVCSHVFCEDDKCSCEHERYLVREMVCRTQSTTQMNCLEDRIQLTRPELKNKYKLPHYDSVISGLACFSDETVVAIDYKYKILAVFRRDKLVFYKDMQMEPKALTKVQDGKIAVTFAYEKKIRIFEIQIEKIVEFIAENISLEETGKPFNISYSNNHFAVEIGEGIYGFIALIDLKGSVIKKISHDRYSFGYFTSNTLRIALDMKKQLLYTSAIGKKSIYCVDFDGRIKWRLKVPSPREIHLVPTNDSGKIHILFASNRGNAVYQLIEKEEKLLESDPVGGVLMNKEMDGLEKPEYIAYNAEKKMLCVGLESGEINVYFFQHGLLEEWIQRT